MKYDFKVIEEKWQKAGNYKDMFWEIGDALMRYGDEEEKERIAHGNIQQLLDAVTL